MKGIIVDRKGRYAVVLTSDGSFTKILNKANYKPGNEIDFNKPYQLETGLLAKISSIAAVFLFTLALSYGAYSYTVPYSYVDLDINPSIELTANIYDIIIKTETFNEDGEKLLQKHKVNFKKLDAGIAELVGSAIEQGYLKAQTENAVLLTITSKNELKKKKLEKHMEDAAVKTLDLGKVKSDIISQQSSAEKHDEAKDLGISPGKLTLIEKALTAEPELELKDLKDASVKAIMKHIKDSRTKEKQDKNSNKHNDRQQQKQDEEDNKQDKEIKQDKEEKQDTEDKIMDKEEKQDTEDKRQDKEEKQDKEDEGDKDDNEKDQHQDKIDGRDNVKNDRGNSSHKNRDVRNYRNSDK